MAMRAAKTSAIIGAALTVALTSARAADMPPILQRPPVMVEEFGSNWYLRGDIGYRAQQVGGGSNWNGLAIGDAAVDDTFMFGGGVGYKWNFLRVDVTGDYAVRSEVRGTALGGPSVGMEIDTFTVLLNAYADLGTWYGFTPYVGGGVGAANHRADGYFNSSLPGTTIPSSNRWNFVWALMAGVSYGVTPNVVIDLGYRYLHLGDAQSGIDATPSSFTASGLNANEVRLGVRYLIN
jgi:opacity protein-like surface antigen